MAPAPALSAAALIREHAPRGRRTPLSTTRSGRGRPATTISDAPPVSCSRPTSSPWGSSIAPTGGLDELGAQSMDCLPPWHSPAWLKSPNCRTRPRKGLPVGRSGSASSEPRRNAGLAGGISGTPTFVFNDHQVDPVDRWTGGGHTQGEGGFLWRGSAPPFGMRFDSDSDL